jgi:uncharacterized cupredoxin-like copper-binding protein
MPTASHRPYRVRALGALCALGLLAAACGDDDDTGTSAGDTPAEGETASGEFAEYCAATAELDEQDGPPTAEQMERIKGLAPDEISDDVEYVADAFIEADGDMGAVFSDPEVEERLGTIEDWEADNCDGGGEFAVAPEHQEYCDFVEELDNQDGPPTNEQLERIKEIRPDSIGEDTDMVADAFIAADGDFGQVFSDPEIEAAFSRMEEHDAEICGFDDGGEDDEVATEPIEGAEVIQVVGIDFEFEGIPDEVPAGDVSFEFSNEGEAAHEMIVFKLAEGADMDELLAREEPPGDDEAEEVGFTWARPGEGGVYLNAEGLDAGTYAVVCFIPGPDGKAHHELGMKQTFTVS